MVWAGWFSLKNIGWGANHYFVLMRSAGMYAMALC